MVGISSIAAATQKNQCWGDWPNGEEVNTNRKKKVKYAQNEDDDDDDGNQDSGKRDR